MRFISGQLTSFLQINLGHDPIALTFACNASGKIQMPMKTVLSLIGIVAIGTMSYFGIQEKINQHSTRLDLMEADLLKKAEQTPKNLEMYMLIEHNAKLIEKHQKQLDENIHTKVLLKEAEKKILKLQEDVEKLIRKNGVK